MNQFYNESVDNDELIFCTQQAEIVLKAEIQQNTIVNPPNKPKSSNIPPIVEPKISTKPPASDPKPVINEIDVYFDDSFSDLLSNIDVIMEQAGSKTPVKSTVLPSKPNLPSTSTLSSASNFSKAILNSSNSTNSSNSGFPRHVSMPLKKIEAPAKTLCSKVNNMERHTSLNFNQQSTKSNNMKNYNSTESVQSSGESWNIYFN